MPMTIANSNGPIIPSSVIMAISIPLPALLFGSPKQVEHAINNSVDEYKAGMRIYFKYLILYCLEFFQY